MLVSFITIRQVCLYVSNDDNNEMAEGIAEVLEL